MNCTGNVGLVFLGNALKFLREIPDCLLLLWEIIADEDVDKQARSIAAGTVIYVLQPWDMIPDGMPGIGYIDDAIMIRIALEAIMEHSPASLSLYRAKYPELFSAFSEEMAVLRSTLGSIFTWLRGRVESLGSIAYKGKTAEEILDSQKDMEQLCEVSMSIVANYSHDEKNFLKEVRTMEKLLPFFKKSMGEDRLLFQEGD